MCICSPLQYHGAPLLLTDILSYMNLTFTLCFTVECILKLISYGPGVNFTLCCCSVYSISVSMSKTFPVNASLCLIFSPNFSNVSLETCTPLVSYMKWNNIVDIITTYPVLCLHQKKGCQISIVKHSWKIVIHWNFSISAFILHIAQKNPLLKVKNTLSM